MSGVSNRPDLLTPNKHNQTDDFLYLKKIIS